MRIKRDQNGKIFSSAIGIMIIAVGVAWLFQSAGFLPGDIKVLDYFFPICVILAGVRVLMGHTANGKNNEQQALEDYNGKM